MAVACRLISPGAAPAVPHRYAPWPRVRHDGKRRVMVVVAFMNHCSHCRKGLCRGCRSFKACHGGFGGARPKRRSSRHTSDWAHACSSLSMSGRAEPKKSTARAYLTLERSAGQ
jgi:hypothetical protein